MAYSDVSMLIQRLRAASIAEVHVYEAKLHSNRRDQDVQLDLRAEGHAALALTDVGFSVKLRDRPDLHMELGADVFFAEVKHFRRKALDEIDDARLKGPGHRLVPYGDTLASEGLTAVDQLVSVASRKASRFPLGCPTILVIQSSSTHCVEETDVDDAVKLIGDRISADPGHDLARLAGILFLSASYNCSRHRNVYFFETNNLLSSRVVQALDEIYEWGAGRHCTHSTALGL